MYPEFAFYRECVEPPVLGRSSVANRGLGRDEREADRSQPNRRLRATTDTRPHDVGHLDFLASTQITPGSGQRSHEMAAITGKKSLSSVQADFWVAGSPLASPPPAPTYARSAETRQKLVLRMYCGRAATPVTQTTSRKCFPRSVRRSFFI